MTKETFTCNDCGETYEKGWSDDEANKEAEKLFGIIYASENPDMVMVCDDCFNKTTGFIKEL